MLEPSNFCCPPAKPGVYLTEIRDTPQYFTKIVKYWGVSLIFPLLETQLDQSLRPKKLDGQ